MPANEWSSFWKKPNGAFNRVMQVSTDFFFRQLMRRYSPGPGTTVLDYGCGPGFLVRNLVAAGATVTGADINEPFLHQDRVDFQGTEFLLIPDNANVNLEGRRFDFIILLSIVQYFKSPEDVETVISFLKDHIKPDGRIILADVLNKHTSSTRDAIGIFLQCIRRGRVFAFARFILYLMMSDYRETSNRNKLLQVSPDFVKQMADRCSLVVEELENMTPHPTRSNYILRLKG